MLDLLFNGRTGDNVCTVPITKVKESENGFLIFSCDIPQCDQ